MYNELISGIQPNRRSLGQSICVSSPLVSFVGSYIFIDYVDDSESDVGELGEDDDDDTFLRTYSDAMNEELKATTLQKSFVRANEQIPENQVFVCICIRKEYAKCYSVSMCICPMFLKSMNQSFN